MRLDVDVPNAFILDVPLELSLELVTAIRADRVNAKGELLDDVVDELDCVHLVVPVVDLQCSHPSCVIFP